MNLRTVTAVMVAGLLVAPSAWGMDGHGRHHGRGMGGHRLLMMARMLGLSDSQQAQIRKLYFAAKRRKVKLVSKLQLARIDLHEAMSTGRVPNQAKVTKLVKGIGWFKTQIKLEKLKLRIAVRKLLTAEQFKKMREMKMRGPMRRHPMGGRGPGGWRHGGRWRHGR